MRQIYYSGQFKKDVKQAQKRGKSIKKLKFLISLIIENKPLPARYRNHPLKGQWRGFRDANVEPDWILIYKDDDKFVRFERTGKHSDLFNE